MNEWMKFFNFKMGTHSSFLFVLFTFEYLFFHESEKSSGDYYYLNSAWNCCSSCLYSQVSYIFYYRQFLLFKQTKEKTTLNSQFLNVGSTRECRVFRTRISEVASAGGLTFSKYYIRVIKGMCFRRSNYIHPLSHFQCIYLSLISLDQFCFSWNACTFRMRLR